MLGDITSDLSTLLRQEVELAKAELRESVDHAKAAGGMFAGAGVAGHLALIFLSLALWWALGDLFDSLGWSAVVVGLLWAVAAGVMAAMGRTRMQRATPLAPRTVDTAKDIPEALKGHETAMTTTNDPDAIRAEIDRTRGRLSEDVDVLTESVRPSSVAKRTAQRATGRASRLKETVMGTAHDTTSAGSDKAHECGRGGQGRAGPGAPPGPGQPAGRRCGRPRRRLAGGLAPARQREGARAATTAKDQAQPLVDEAKSVAQETAQDLKEPAQQAARVGQGDRAAGCRARP